MTTKQIIEAAKAFKDIRARQALESEDQVNFILGRNPNRPQPPEGSVIDPALNRGPIGFIEQDPAGFAKGIASAPFTAAPDILGLAQQGMNALAGPVQERLGLPQVGFDPMSGDPIREAIGLDPESPQGIAGEVASPVGTFAKALGISAKAVTAGAKLAAGTNFDPSLAMTLFHGSPFKFNKFESAKIGTGEGAQAFGHGLYFAENPGVARSYQQNLSRHFRFSGSNAIINGKPFNEIKATLPAKHQVILDSALNDMAEGFQRGWFDDLEFGDEMADTIDFKIRQSIVDPDNGLFGIDGQPLPISQADADSIGEVLKSAKFDKNSGNLYEVEIPDSVTNRMLDWDAPLSEQPEILSKLRRLANDPDTPLTGNTASQLNDSLQSFELDSTTGATIVRLLGGDEIGSDLLKQSGIPGIRFFDQQSRGAAGIGQTIGAREKKILEALANNPSKADEARLLKELDELEAAPQGTRNIVVFNPDDITQVKRDGDIVHQAGKPKVPSFPDAGNGNIRGYRVDLAARSPKVGDITTSGGDALNEGVFVGKSPKYVEDFYSHGGTDPSDPAEVIVEIEFNPKDITRGNIFDLEPEVVVQQGKGKVTKITPIKKAEQ